MAELYFDLTDIKFAQYMKPPWRNRLARSAVNRKVGGSSPPGGEGRSVLSTRQPSWSAIGRLQRISLSLG